jgi:hypothetical protein
MILLAASASETLISSNTDTVNEFTIGLTGDAHAHRHEGKRQQQRELRKRLLEKESNCFFLYYEVRTGLTAARCRPV